MFGKLHRAQRQWAEAMMRSIPSTFRGEFFVFDRLATALTSTSDSSIYVEQREPLAWPRMAHQDSDDPTRKVPLR
jgi:hypothetical protein